MTDHHTPGPYEAVPDTAFDDLPASGWAIFAGDEPAIAILLGRNAEANAAFFANAPRRWMVLKAIAETPLEGEDCEGQPQRWHDYQARFEQIIRQARAAVATLDFCGLDCPHCGADDALGAVESRPLKPGEKAPVACIACGFVDAHVQREEDGSLILHPGHA